MCPGIPVFPSKITGDIHFTCWGAVGFTKEKGVGVLALTCNAKEPNSSNWSRPPIAMILSFLSLDSLDHLE